jgi:hypothetical protein
MRRQNIWLWLAAVAEEGLIQGGILVVAVAVLAASALVQACP